MKKVAKFAGWIAAAMLALFLAVQLSFFLRLWWWRDHDPQATAFMNERLAALRKKDPRATLQHRWVPYDRISGNLKRAIVVAEDSRFVDHEGFDWEAIEK
ncbi:MAG TPA: transglycosylase domain-containing protein, partial [Usitatibacter sp.]|nr:transglycosylase domain-containing protein [Usitatibacter sp.]